MVKPNLNASSLIPEPVLLNHRLFCHVVAKAKLSLVGISVYVLNWHNCLSLLIEGNIYLDILMEDNPFMIYICVCFSTLFWIDVSDPRILVSRSPVLGWGRKLFSFLIITLHYFTLYLSLKLKIACSDFIQQIVS